MRPADKAQWLGLRRALWPDCPEERHLLEIDLLLRSEGIVLIAEAPDGQAAGFVEVSVRHDHVEGTASAPVAYLEGWYVAPAYRGRGCGRALMAAAEQWALEAGFSELASDAELDNDSAIRAHANLGFREVGRTVHFVRRLS